MVFVSYAQVDDAGERITDPVTLRAALETALAESESEESKAESQRVQLSRAEASFNFCESKLRHRTMASSNAASLLATYDYILTCHDQATKAGVHPPNSMKKSHT